MYWNDDTNQAKVVEVSDDIVDVNFKIKCTHLPIDHAHDLSTAIIKALPWIEENEHVGIHLIHGAESGNGWIRPQDPDALIYPSRRTLFSIRVPKECVQNVMQLDGKVVKVGDVPLQFSNPSVRMLSRISTIYARYVFVDEVADEPAFLREIAGLLVQKEIKPKRMMSGRITPMRFPSGVISTRSLMIDGIGVSGSVRLQQEGVGSGRKFGCGIFLPHKSIEAVNAPQEK